MTKVALIDADVHHNWKNEADVRAYLPKRWRDSITDINPAMLWIQQSFGTNARLDSFGEDGAVPGSDYELMKQQYLDPFNVKKAKLSFYIGQNGGLANPYAAREIIRAINDWNQDHWLSIDDDRLVSVALLATQVPADAAAEIRRLAKNPKIVEALLVPNPLGKPFGHPVYDPIYEAASEVGMPVGIHIGGEAFSKSTGQVAGGAPNCKIDNHSLAPQSMAHHIASFITHGVFEKFPKLKLMIIEAGVAWLPIFMWKMDAMFDQLRQESDWVKKRPSDYLRQHCRTTTQPFDAGPTPRHMIELMKAFGGMEDLLCYASDYPHWDAENPYSINAKVPHEWHAKMFYANAAEFYGFEKLSDAEILGKDEPSPRERAEEHA